LGNRTQAFNIDIIVAEDSSGDEDVESERVSSLTQGVPDEDKTL